MSTMSRCHIVNNLTNEPIKTVEAHSKSCENFLCSSNRALGSTNRADPVFQAEFAEWARYQFDTVGRPLIEDLFVNPEVIKWIEDFNPFEDLLDRAWTFTKT